MESPIAHGVRRAPRVARATLVLALSLLLSLPALACWSSHSRRPVERDAFTFHSLLVEGDYVSLEALSERSRDPLARTADGQTLRAAWSEGLSLSDAYCHARVPSMDTSFQVLLDIYRSRIAAWLAKYPDSVSAQLANANYFVQAAYVARGNEYASKVKPEAWPVFRADLEKAWAALESAPPAVRADAEWYRLRLIVARLQSWDAQRYRELLDAALQAHPDYEPMYFEALEYFQPRWGGSTEIMDAFIEEAVSRTQARMGQALYARLNSVNKSPNMFSSGRVSWPRVKEGYERIVADYPDVWNLNKYASFACIARDRDTLQALLPRIDRVAPEAWGSKEAYAKCTELVAGPGAGTPGKWPRLE